MLCCSLYVKDRILILLEFLLKRTKSIGNFESAIVENDALSQWIHFSTFSAVVVVVNVVVVVVMVWIESVPIEPAFIDWSRTSTMNVNNNVEMWLKCVRNAFHFNISTFQQQQRRKQQNGTETLYRNPASRSRWITRALLRITNNVKSILHELTDWLTLELLLLYLFTAF